MAELAEGWWYSVSSVQHTEIPVNTNSLETVAIKLSNNLIIVSLYNPPNSKIKANDLNILNILGNKLLTFGDFNAKNNSWNCKSNNANGGIILDFSFDNMFKIIAPNGFTLSTLITEGHLARSTLGSLGILNVILTKKYWTNSIQISSPSKSD